MSTLTQPRFDAAEMQRRVRHPLQSLRGTIRSYVVLEGALVALLYLAIGFWVGMALDFGPAYLFGFDWLLELQDTTRNRADVWIRGILLTLYLAGLVALVTYKVFFRLFREFRDDALALVLERRFPKQLGDRLITAVELADPRNAEKYGFSGQMVQKTIQEAADRVERVPVGEVFNWGRLKLMGLFCGLATLGVYLGLMITGMILISAEATEDRSPSTFNFFGRFNKATGTWFSREVMLRDRYWPRQGYLELVRFHDSPRYPGEMPIPKVPPRPDLNVRAYRWVITDESPARQYRTLVDPETEAESQVLVRVHYGWRPLAWPDLAGLARGDDAWLGLVNTIQAELKDWEGWPVQVEDMDPRVPRALIPAEWQGMPVGAIQAKVKGGDKETNFQIAALSASGYKEATERLLNWQTWTLDRIQLTYNSPKVRADLAARHPAALKALEDLFAVLEDRALARDNRGRFRMLEVPDKVEFVFKPTEGKGTLRNEYDQVKEENLPQRKYEIKLNELDDSGSFHVHALDYYTPARKIRLVPPVNVSKVTQHLEEPAYFYHRDPGNPAALARLHQVVEDRVLPVAGEQVDIEVKYGTRLGLTFHTDRRLKGAVQMRQPAELREKGAALPPAAPVMGPKGKGFRLDFADVTTPYEFDLDFIDEDHVKGTLHVLVKASLDKGPEATLKMEAPLRKPKMLIVDPKDNKIREGEQLDAFLITPNAEIPLRGFVKDDYGLGEVNWVYEYEEIDLDFEVYDGKIRGRGPLGPIRGPLGPIARNHLALFGAAMQVLPGGEMSLLLTPLHVEKVAEDIAPKRGKVPVSSFRKAQKDLPLVSADAPGFKDRLRSVPPAPNMVVRHPLVEEDSFFVDKYLPQLNAVDPTTKKQRHFLLRISLEAVDINVDTGPGVGRSPITLTFLVASEEELLTQIAQEEKRLRGLLEKAEDELRHVVTSLEELHRGISPLLAKDPDTTSHQEFQKKIREKSLRDAPSYIRETANAYNRILKEMNYNMVQPERTLDIYNKIVDPLDRMVRADGELSAAEKSLNKLVFELDKDLDINAPHRTELTDLAKEALDKSYRLSETLAKVLANLEGNLTWTAAVGLLDGTARRQLDLVQGVTRWFQIYLKDLGSDLK